MITLEEAQELLPVGTRVWGRHRDTYGTIAVRPPGGVGNRPAAVDQVYDTDVSGWCCSVNVLWDDGPCLWTDPADLIRWIDGRALPDLAQAVSAAMTELGKGLAQMRRTMAAQGAMGWAYRGDLEQLRTALAALPAAQVREVSAAAALLASTADDVLTGKGAE